MPTYAFTTAETKGLMSYLGRGPRTMPAILEIMQFMHGMAPHRAGILLDRMITAGFVRQDKAVAIHRGRLYGWEYALTPRYALHAVNGGLPVPIRGTVAAGRTIR